MPSSRASACSQVKAGISSPSPGTSSARAAPQRTAVRAASTATLPPPITSTSCPSFGGLIEGGGREELQHPVHARAVAGHRQRAAAGQPRGDEHGRETRREELVDGLVLADRDAGDELHTVGADPVHVHLHHVARQAVDGDGRGGDAAGARVLLKDGRAVAAPGQFQRRGQARGPGADDRDGLAVLGRRACGRSGPWPPARSATKRFSSRMATAESTSLRRQLASQGWWHTRPQTLAKARWRRMTSMESTNRPWARHSRYSRMSAWTGQL